MTVKEFKHFINQIPDKYDSELIDIEMIDWNVTRQEVNFVVGEAQPRNVPLIMIEVTD